MQRKEKAAAILADHDGNDSETQQPSKERIMKNNTKVPVATVIRNRDDQPVHEDSPLMATLISADSARRAVDRSKYSVTYRTGRQVHPDEITLQILANGDQQTKGGSANRADYTVTAVKL